MKVNPTLFGILAVLSFFGTIYGFQSAGFWSTSGKVSASGGAILPDASDVNTIKGWMTLEQISSIYIAPFDEIRDHFKFPAGTTPSTAIKDLESDDFDLTMLREWLLTRSKTIQDLSPANTPTTPAIATEAFSGEPPSTIEATSGSGKQPGIITGKTTFQELLDWGVSEDAIQKILGKELPDPAYAIKDYASEQGLEFSDIKAQLQAALDLIQ